MAQTSSKDKFVIITLDKDNKQWLYSNGQGHTCDRFELGYTTGDFDLSGLIKITSIPEGWGWGGIGTATAFYVSIEVDNLKSILQTVPFGTIGVATSSLVNERSEQIYKSFRDQKIKLLEDQIQRLQKKIELAKKN